MKPSISVVAPVFRSGSTLLELHRRLAAALDALAPQWELILVDDASNDGTFERMLQIREADNRVRLVRFARNMGQHHATLCGLQRARGEFVVTIDDDLQHQPEDIGRLLIPLRHGYDLVIASISANKRHGKLRNLASAVVQRMVCWILAKPREIELSSFRAMSHRAARSIAAYSGAHPYLPALMFWSVPFDRIVNVPVEHASRLSGASTYSLRKMLKLVSFLLINHSAVPLRLVSGLGLMISVLSVGYAAYVAIHAIVEGRGPAGWASLAVLVSFLSGATLFCLGIVGEYVGRLVEERSRPGQFPVFEEHD